MVGCSLQGWTEYSKLVFLGRISRRRELGSVKIGKVSLGETSNGVTRQELANVQMVGCVFRGTERPNVKVKKHGRFPFSLEGEEELVQLLLELILD